MACNLTQSFLKSCRENVGGTLEFYFSYRPTTFSTTIGASGISAYTGTCTWYKYVPRKQTSTFATNIKASEENGTVFYESTVQLILTKMEQNKQNEIYLLAQADLLCIVKDQNGKYWLLGETNGVTMVDSSGTVGTAYGDRNGYELNFIASEPSKVNEILYSAFSAQIAA